MKWLKADNLPKTINVDDLSISFSQPFHDYVIYAPWNSEEYITHIGEYTLGFGARYLLLRALEQIKSVMGPVIDTHNLRVSPVPKLDVPIVRRLGKRYLCPIRKRINDQRTRFMPLLPDVNEITDGDVNIIKEVNRKEENFEVSNL
jgi:hypothetical protein